MNITILSSVLGLLVVSYLMTFAFGTYVHTLLIASNYEYLGLETLIYLGQT
jgi:hypothetical protein